MYNFFDVINGTAAKEYESRVVGGAKAKADADLAVTEQNEVAARNESTAARQNQSAMMNREGTRAGGGRYRRRGQFMTGGSGLNAANAQARTEARRKAAYAGIDQQHSDMLKQLRNPVVTTSFGPLIRAY